MFRIHQQYVILTPQFQVTDVLILGRSVADDNVRRLIQQFVRHIVVGTAELTQAHIGILYGEIPKHVRQEVVHAAAETQHVLIGLVHPLNGLRPLGKLVERQLHAAQKHPSILVEQYLALPVLEQRDAKLFFEPRYAFAQVRLSHEKLLRRLRYIACFRYCLEISQLGQIHRPSRSFFQQFQKEISPELYSDCILLQPL